MRDGIRSDLAFSFAKDGLGYVMVLVLIWHSVWHFCPLASMSTISIQWKRY